MRFAFGWSVWLHFVRDSERKESWCWENYGNSLHQGCTFRIYRHDTTSSEEAARLVEKGSLFFIQKYAGVFFLDIRCNRWRKLHRIAVLSRYWKLSALNETLDRFIDEVIRFLRLWGRKAWRKTASRVLWEPNFKWFCKISLREAMHVPKSSCPLIGCRFLSSSTFQRDDKSSCCDWFKWTKRHFDEMV